MKLEPKLKRQSTYRNGRLSAGRACPEVVSRAWQFQAVDADLMCVGVAACAVAVGRDRCAPRPHASGPIVRGLRHRKVVSFMALSNRPENLRASLQ
jgi:hypothetical protein